MLLINKAAIRPAPKANWVHESSLSNKTNHCIVCCVFVHELEMPTRNVTHTAVANQRWFLNVLFAYFTSHVCTAAHCCTCLIRPAWHTGIQLCLLERERGRDSIRLHYWLTSAMWLTEQWLQYYLLSPVSPPPSHTYLPLLVHVHVYDVFSANRLADYGARICSLARRECAIRGLPSMTSALEGGKGGSRKVDKSTDKLRDHVCDEGSKNSKFSWTSLMEAPLVKFS